MPHSHVMGPIDGLLADVARGRRVKYLPFWGHRPRPDGRIGASCLSQWWPSPFTVDGVAYASAEHWMMAAKARLFGDTEAERAALSATSPAAAKKAGRLVRGFDEDVWARERFALVVEGSLHKFGQDPELAKLPAVHRGPGAGGGVSAGPDLGRRARGGRRAGGAAAGVAGAESAGLRADGGAGEAAVGRLDGVSAVGRRAPGPGRAAGRYGVAGTWAVTDGGRLGRYGAAGTGGRASAAPRPEVQTAPVTVITTRSGLSAQVPPR